MNADGSPKKKTTPEIKSQDYRFHNWYRFVLAFPPHLVREYFADFGLHKNSVVLDPFCGTGTTLVEAKLAGVSSLGIEANPFVCFASTVKTDWDIDADMLQTQSMEIAEIARNLLRQQGLDDNHPSTTPPVDISLYNLSQEQEQLMISGAVSSIPLHKVLILRECIEKHGAEQFSQLQMLALANTLVTTASNIRFVPDVRVLRPKLDAPVVSAWIDKITEMTNDLHAVKGQTHPQAQVFWGDARCVGDILPPQSVDAVITSPPYPNEKDYTRITRLESVVLGFINTRSDLQRFKKGLLRSNSRMVYRDDDDDRWIEGHTEIEHLADTIERRRIELGKTSGFEKAYAKLTKLYFGGMARHLASLQAVLRPNALLAYVVGDQASYFRVMIRTGPLLADIARALGYELVRIDLFRTRPVPTTGTALREEVVVLRWRG